MHKNNNKSILTFLFLTLALSSIFYYLIISAGRVMASGGLYAFGLMWCPGTAALLTRLIYQKNVRELGWGWGKTWYQALSYIIPLIAFSVVYIPVWLTGLGGFSKDDFTKHIADSGGLNEPLSFGLSIIIQATVGFLLCALPAIGEEIGWRGFLTPELAKRIGFTKTSLLIGIIWTIWHYPLFLVDFAEGTPKLLALVCFTLNTIGLTLIMTWIRLKSGSLWTGVVLHASYNLFLEGFFNVLTVNKVSTELITTDFGIGGAIVYLIVAFIFWKKRSELPMALEQK